MTIKNFHKIAKIIKIYNFYLFIIIFFEILYIFKGYKGNKFNFSDNDSMSDNIPCPYYFLAKIKKTLKNKEFDKFLDLGCGSGRAINFFNKNFPNKSFIGIEYFAEQYQYCKRIFQQKKNIEIFQINFTKIDLSKYNADCYFFNEPFKNIFEFTEFINKIINFSSNKRKVLFIFVNHNKKTIEELENIKCIESFYINNTRGYSICCLK
tara:strand:+ start:725 stop:1348 length:624 start_codon:yes stop_codon:yes gene_type:complete